MSLRSHLYLLALSVLAPLIALAFVAGYIQMQGERETMQREAVGRTRAVMSAVDAALVGEINALRALAASASLEASDIRAFHEESRRVLRSQPNWLNVGLIGPAGEQFAQAVLPYGAPLPSALEMPSVKRAAETQIVQFGDVAQSLAVDGAPVIRLRLPVMYGGEVRYLLSVPIKLQLFADLLAAQGLPENWVIVLVDRQQRFIARIPPRPPGDSISPSFREALARAPEGFFRGETVEGLQTYTPYVTSALSGWVLGVAIPQSVVEAGARRAGALMFVGTLIALAVALLLAWLLSRRIERPITALARSAERLRHGGVVDIPLSARITQIRTLAEAFAVASSAIREREDVLLREKKVLEQTDRAKDEFIAMLSHELRNPLAALVSAAEVQNRAPPGSEAAVKSREVIARQTRHMTRLVEDLLDLSRIVTGNVALSRAPVNLADGVNHAVAALRDAGRLDDHKVSLDLEPAWVNADRARIEQIVTNLLDNALKFTPPGRRIEVRVHHSGDEAVLSVADDGDGIAPENLESIFDLFVQGERGLDRQKGGLGIGLALVKRLVALHEGSVSAESGGPGRGATFTVRLPAVASGVSHAAARPHLDGEAHRILLVEDNDDARVMMRAMLTLSGHLVHEAADGTTALSLAENALPDVALIDIGLPDIDGFEVARRLRASPVCANAALIALTGYGQPQDVRRALDAGFDAHLVKPVGAEELQAAIARVGQRAGLALNEMRASSAG
ncbi:MAG: hybrid sensor histidine kinase/response regulator [Betaproteobacteria bacterium]